MVAIHPTNLNNCSKCPAVNDRLGSRSHTRSPSHTRRHGFTLVEMVVAVAVIVILVTLVLPAANALWAQRKGAEAQNTIQGLLMTARAKALAAGRTESSEFRFWHYDQLGNLVPSPASGGETGLLFYVDKRGVQRILSIAQVNAGDVAWQNVFGVMPARDRSLPEPMRVVPRYVVDEPAGTNDPDTFSEDELANNEFSGSTGANVAQRHRNFFTMIYSDEGHLLTWRDVLIYDEDVNEDGFGDRTGLKVGTNPSSPNVAEYYQTNGNEADIDPTNPPGGPQLIPYLVTGGYDAGPGDVALNLPSVDGLLVYDDALFKGITDEAYKREYLLREGEPFYVNRLTGAVIRGPRGENSE